MKPRFVFERRWTKFKGFINSNQKNCSSQCHDVALTILGVPNFLDKLLITRARRRCSGRSGTTSCAPMIPGLPLRGMMAHTRLSRSDSGLVVQVKAIQSLQVVPSTLGSGPRYPPRLSPPGAILHVFLLAPPTPPRYVQSENKAWAGAGRFWMVDSEEGKSREAWLTSENVRLAGLDACVP